MDWVSGSMGWGGQRWWGEVTQAMLSACIWGSVVQACVGRPRQEGRMLVLSFFLGDLALSGGVGWGDSGLRRKEVEEALAKT